MVNSRQRPWLKYLGVEPLRSGVYLSVSVVVKIAVQIINFSHGFLNVSADEFARGIRAAAWALQPRFDILADVKGTWLPLEKYLNGSLLSVWPDVIWAPRVTVFIASCLVLIALFAFTYYLFDNFWVAALAGVFVACQPWYAWLSGTPMLEMYYLACFWGGLVFLGIWLREARRGYWFWAGCCFMLASGFHVQSWTLINLVNLTTVGYLYRNIAHRRWGRLLQLIGFYALGNLFIGAFSLIEFFSTGQLFAFLARHTSYSKLFYNGYDVSVWEKLLYYPRLIVQNSSGVVWVLLLVALVFLWRNRTHQGKWLPLTTAALVLSVTSALNVLSGPPSAAPGRYSLLYVLLIAPYVAYGAYRLFTVRKHWSPRVVAYVPALLSTALFLYSLWWGAVRIPDFPPGMPISAVKTGAYLNQILSRNPSTTGETYMVELKYWEFLAVELTARHYDAIVFDRVKDPVNRNTPSIFTDNPAGVYARLLTQNIRYVALQDPRLKANVQQMDFMRPAQEIDDWTIYEFQPDRE